MKRVLIALALCLGVALSLVAYDIVGKRFFAPIEAEAQTDGQLAAAVTSVATSQAGTPSTRAQAATRTRPPSTATRTPVPPTATSAPVPPTAVPPTTPPTPAVQPTLTPVVVNGRRYNAYIPSATKEKQYFHYTCEFDAAWVIFETYGFDVSLEDQIEAVGLDESVEPYYEEGQNGIAVIYGGDIGEMYSGHYDKNFLARSSGQAFRKAFEHYGLKVTPVHTRKDLQDALLRGELVWIKATADFKPGRESIWIKPDGEVFKTEDGQVYKTVLGNDHAVVVMGFNEEVVVIRDVLGPTNTNWNRKYEYELPWKQFLSIWGSQSYDGLAVAPPK
ncbi:MAG TPA: hypothetical protein VF826_13750 [Chloroflexia bacterium]